MNISYRLEHNARELKSQPAVIDQRGRSLTHGEFLLTVNRYANALRESGVREGDKVLLFVKPDLHFLALTFALFRMKAIPIMMDPGMGLKNVLLSIAQVGPDVMIGIPLLMWLRFLWKSSMRSIRLYLSYGLSGVTSDIKKLAKSANGEFTAPETRDDDLAAILFTSGGTGRPKGVEYTHGIFDAQTKILQRMFNLSSKESDLPCFPLFGLFTLAMGMKVVIPRMNPSRPAKANPKELVEQIRKHQLSFVAGSPAIWERVADYCHENKVTLNSVRYLVMFGAPVRVELHQKLLPLLPNGNTYAPYGATECLPVACFDGKSVLSQTALQTLDGKGVCVGPAVDGSQVSIISISDEKRDHFDEGQALENGVIGEIVVHSPWVTPAYYQMPSQTELAKMREGEKLWHRMGDVGYLDEKGRLWFCGRKSHRVEVAGKTHFSIPVEAAFNQHPLVRRSSLIKLRKGDQLKAALVVEREDKRVRVDEHFFKELRSIAQSKDQSQDIEDFFLHPGLPVDGRHNIKIDRLALSKWAQGREL